jgi:catechol 2,3-dioxygenase-like lactoylglutathione lyase family enzyme
MIEERKPVRNIRHFGIVVRDMDLSLGFYRDLLGLAIRSRREERGPYLDALLGVKNGKIQTVKLSAGAEGPLLELIHFTSPRPREQGERKVFSLGPTHVALTVAHLGRLSQTLKGKGIRFLSGPLTSPDGKAVLAFCRDPEGNLVELVEERT